MIAWTLFLYGGWIPFTSLILKLAWDMRLIRLGGKFFGSIEYVMLAIDIPKLSEQKPKAMEQVFATISAAHSPLSKRDKYVRGIGQLSFSFEIISIDGYIQFLIRSPKVYRDLVEAAVYAQYPDAEITEVEDYTKDLPTTFPNDQYNLWGSEVSLVKKDAYPIRTYVSFEDKLSQEIKDPIAGLVETMSRIQKNEQVWLQIIVCPTDTAWVKGSIKEAQKLAGRKPPQKKSYFSSIFGLFYNLPNWFVWTQQETLTAKPEKLIDLGGMINLTPGERANIENIELKASKIGFVCKLRLIYLSPPQQYQPQRVVSSVFGAIKQFGDLNSNAFKPNTRTKTALVWFMVEQRVNARRGRLIRNYKNRSWFSGSNFFILNTEELATLYHFPALQIKSAMLNRTEVKKSDAPSNLPSTQQESSQEAALDLRQSLVSLQLDNRYYEDRYAVDPSKIQQKKPPTEPTIAVVAEAEQKAPDNLPIS